MLVPAVVVVAGLLAALPHGLRLTRVAPASAAAIWMFALALRAALVVSAAIAALVLVPQSHAFRDLAQACWHAAGLDVSGHPLADAATALPAIALAASSVWVAASLARSALALSAYLRGRERGRGPMGSTLIAESDVLLAASTLGRARVFVSHGALSKLDQDELTAGMAHEHGHLRRHHRPLLLLADVLTTVSRPLPGSATVRRQLHLNLERDADEYAVARTQDPLSLASAICKAAVDAPAGVAALGGGADLGVRLEQLVEYGGRRRSPARVERRTRVLAGAMAGVVLAFLVAMPSWAVGSLVSVRAAHLAVVAPH